MFLIPKATSVSVKQPKVTLLHHQQVKNIRQVRNLNRSYLVGLSFLRGRGVIPFIKKHHLDGNYKFWPDLASSHYANSDVNYLIDQNIKFEQKCENPANVPEVQPIEDFLSIINGKVYDNGWRAKNLDELRKRIRHSTRNMDQNLVQDLLASTSKRLNNIRRNEI
ncbi:glucosylceramidase 4 [Brachionus plicatilis]|uniref:Glucosylceramidase 4 n=1 Tax=Brachionus plicatilis TaxID=10195 RepID=A0A3M7RS14_BRAPC|nr:glucosylceramidase 4 [Brachionus plicatilis]